MTDETLAGLMNPHQKRSLMVTLYQLELSFKNINDWLNDRGSQGILYNQKLSLSKANQLDGQEIIREGLDLIANFAKSLKLEKYDENLSSTINSLLHVQWINLEDQHAAKHKRSGEVHPDLSKHLDPLIDELIATVLKLGEIIKQK